MGSVERGEVSTCYMSTTRERGKSEKKLGWLLIEGRNGMGGMSFDLINAMK